MAKVAHAITSFNGGELSPLMAGRTELKFYSNSCKKSINFIPTVQGPARNRPGTKFVASVKTAANRTWLRRFVFSRTAAYQIEFGDLYARFYTNHGVIESSPGVPYEIVTPFTAASLTRADGTFRLRFVQRGDVIYITSDGQYAVQKLIRLTASTFSIAALETTGGPFLDIDPDNTTTVYASAATGAGVTLTASASVFTSAHVGALIFIEQAKVDIIKAWEPGKSITANDLRRSDGKNYKALNTATTGAVKPVHSTGSHYDGDTGVSWQFQDPGYGWAKITGYTSGTTVTATVLSRIPDGAVGIGNASDRWSFGAFNAVHGYPDNVTFYRERLCFAKGLKIYGSASGDYENFNRYDDAGLVTADRAFIIDVSSDEAEEIVWMAPMSSALLIGTDGDEVAIDEITTNDPFGPGNIKSNRQTKHGSSFAGEVVVGDGVIFAQTAGRKIRDMLPAESVDKRWASADVTVLAEHIGRGGFVSMAYQQEPDSVIWCTKTDGSLAGFTLNREQEVKGWHPHRIGGVSDADGAFAVVECVESNPIDGGNEVWMIVRRRVNGATVRYVEYMTQMRNAGDDPEDVFYVDSGLTFDGSVAATLTPGTGANVAGTTGVVFTAGSSVFVAGDVGRRIHYRYRTMDDYGVITWHKAVAGITGYTSGTVVTATIHSAFPNLSVIASSKWRKTATVITGLGHLEGQSVTVCGDGAAFGLYTVTGGSITLSEGVSKAHIGLPYRSALVPMPVEAGGADGTAQGKTKRISRASLRFHESMGVKYGPSESGKLDDLPSRDVSADSMDAPPSLFTGDVVVAWPDGYSTDAPITIVQDNPLPCTLVGIYPHVNVQDNR